MVRGSPQDGSKLTINGVTSTPAFGGSTSFRTSLQDKSFTLQLCSLRSEPSFDTESSFDPEVLLRAERTQCEAGPKGRVEDRVTLSLLKGGIFNLRPKDDNVNLEALRKPRPARATKSPPRLCSPSVSLQGC
jgi:hypothetical protein